jgi:hypothetical protein
MPENVTTLRGKRRRIREDNIKRDAKNVRFEDVCWFKVILGRVHWRTVVHTVMEFRGPYEVRSFVISRLIIDTSRPTLFRGVG